MAIVETIIWRFACPPERATDLIVAAFDTLDLKPERDGNDVRGKAARNMLRNRWKGKLLAEITPTGDGSSRVKLTVDAAGDAHGLIMGEIHEQIPDDIVEDDGIAAAVEALGKLSRVVVRAEVKLLRTLLDEAERVEEIAEGRYGRRHGIVVLTNQRLFFYEKGAVRRTIEQFALGAITSIRENQGLSGDTITIHASGNDAEIGRMKHGDAARFVGAYRALTTRRAAESAAPAAAPPAPAVADPDPFAQIERLGQLRDAGLISAEEYETKKTELLGRL